VKSGYELCVYVVVRQAVLVCFKILSQHLPGKTTETVSQDSWSCSQDFNWGVPEFKAVVLFMILWLQ